MFDYKSFILENKKEETIVSLLGKTVENGATKPEQESSYKKAIDLIKKYNIDVSNLDIDSKVYTKLKTDIQNWRKSKDFKDYTSSEFVKWYDDNHTKLYEVGKEIEDKLKEYSLFDSYDGNPHFIDPEFDDKDDFGWKYYDDSIYNDNYIVYEFKFLPPDNLEKYSKLLQNLVKFKNFFNVSDSKVRSVDSDYKLTLSLYFSLEDLHKNIQKLKLR